MKIIKPSFNIEDLNHEGAGEELIKRIEKAGRICYKSENKITKDSAKEFIKARIESGHESIIEHEKVTVRIICDRGVSHELVRHRIASYSQESTRYCNYSKDMFENEITVIDPSDAFNWKNNGNRETDRLWCIWENSMKQAEANYFELLAYGATPQEARSVLPNSLKTEVIVTMNLRSWKNFFKLRTAAAAHPQMREIAIPMLAEFKKLIPVIFDDI